jgi:hypothetical protein
MQIRFSLETKYGMYSDALNLPDDHTFSESEIEAMKTQRTNNWVAYIDSTQTVSEETPTSAEETPTE